MARGTKVLGGGSDDDGRRTTDDGRQRTTTTDDDGRRTDDDGRRTTTDDGRRHDSIIICLYLLTKSQIQYWGQIFIVNLYPRCEGRFGVVQQNPAGYRYGISRAIR
jgi:hypothetical protein